ncbi:PREDICTED: uncharacterized protein DDB_G0283357-like isoform X1 [Priapulus caudatus]|uniref:Uncharacterized protein DDB_G0283357-like isoform X1 n=1 Tax=Priapulus caudatus TaxID=37621 RepID=A0ABM1EK89_PRICU|nr:PREDICTED: uncharacterized protein DDB_G0283357-like isoform X1 [Priapulus caudatus]
MEMRKVTETLLTTLLCLSLHCSRNVAGQQRFHARQHTAEFLPRYQHFKGDDLSNHGAAAGLGTSGFVLPVPIHGEGLLGYGPQSSQSIRFGQRFPMNFNQISAHGSVGNGVYSGPGSYTIPWPSDNNRRSAYRGRSPRDPPQHLDGTSDVRYSAPLAARIHDTTGRTHVSGRGYGTQYNLKNDNNHSYRDEYHSTNNEDRRDGNGYNTGNEEDRRYGNGYSSRNEEDRRYGNGYNTGNEEDRRYGNGYSSRNEEDRRYGNGYSSRNEEDRRYRNGYNTGNEEDRRYGNGYNTGNEEDRR